MELIDINSARPLPSTEPVNMFSAEYLSKLELEAKKKIVKHIEYITEEREELIVKSALEIAPKILEHAKECRKKNKKFSLAVDGTMNIGKSRLMKHLHFILPTLNEDMVFITVTGYNMLCYSIMYNGELFNSANELIAKIGYQKHFKGNDDTKPNYKELESDAIITNLNNLHKSIELVESLNKEYVVLFDECHTLLLDYHYRNSKISKEDSSRIMDKFKKTLDFCTERKSRCSGVIWCSATMDVFNRNPEFTFTKVFDLDLEEEYKISTNLLRPIHLKGDSILAKMIYIVDWLKNNPEDAILSIYLNKRKDIDKIIKYLKMYVKKFRSDLKDEDIDKFIAVIHSKNTKNNDALNSIQETSTLPDSVRLLFATSYMNAGVEVLIKGKALDIMMFVEKKSFTLINEIQFTGRFRAGVRALYLIAQELKYKKAIDYIQYVEKELQEYKTLAELTIKYIDKYSKKHKCSHLQARDAIYLTNEKDATLSQNHITLVNEKYVVDELAIRNCIFILYHQNYTLSTFKTLTEAFYNHKTMNIKHVSKLKIEDYTHITLEYLGLEEPKKEKKEKVSKAMTVDAITKIIELTTDENREYIRKAILKDNLEFLNYSKEVEEDNGETSILLVNTDEIKKELTTLLNSPRYQKAKLLFSEDKNNNEKIIDDILDIKIPNTKFSERRMDNIVSNIQSSIENTPISEQETEEKNIKKTDRKNGAFVIEAKKAVDLVVTQEKPSNMNITLAMKKAVFEYLAHAGVLQEANIEIEWNNDGTPTQFKKTNKKHVNIVNKAFKLYFNIDKRGRISSRKKL